MGNLEKAGIAVVVVLLGIILVVAFVSEPAGDKSKKSEGGTVADAPKLQPSPNQDTSRPLGASRSTVEQSGGRSPRPMPVVANPRDVGENSRDVSESSPTPSPRPDGNSNRPEGGSTPNPPSKSLWPKETTLLAGESLWKVAAREYGTKLADRMIPALKKENAIKDDRRLKEGMIIKLPAPPIEETSARDSVASDSESKPAPDSAEPEKPKPVIEKKPIRSATAGPAGSGASPRLAFEPTPRNSKTGRSSSGSTTGVYIVKQNEGLAAIARRELGSAKYVKDIVALNGIKDPNNVPAGARLRLPPRN